MDKVIDIELKSVFINNITFECYLCLEDIKDKQYSILKCCDKSTNPIHNSCLFMLYLNSINYELTCPLCRHIFDIKGYLNRNQLKKLYIELQEHDKLIYKNKINIIIPNYYTSFILYTFIITLFGLFIYAIFCISFHASNSSSGRNYPRSRYGRFSI